eukprot:s119_g29.t1
MAVLDASLCRTTGRLRYRQPGPPPLRTREGEERFGIKTLEEPLRRRVLEDTVLWFRAMYWYVKAVRASITVVDYLKEQPEDPERYVSLEEIQKQRFLTFWSFPEWATFKEKYGFVEVSFDQGPAGREKWKPTTIGTSMMELKQLDTMRGPGTGGMQERCPFRRAFRSLQARHHGHQDSELWIEKDFDE